MGQYMQQWQSWRPGGNGITLLQGPHAVTCVIVGLPGSPMSSHANSCVPSASTITAMSVCCGTGRCMPSTSVAVDAGVLAEVGCGSTYSTVRSGRLDRAFAAVACCLTTFNCLLPTENRCPPVAWLRLSWLSRPRSPPPPSLATSEEDVADEGRAPAEGMPDTPRCRDMRRDGGVDALARASAGRWTALMLATRCG